MQLAQPEKLRSLKNGVAANGAEKLNTPLLQVPTAKYWRRWSPDPKNSYATYTLPSGPTATCAPCTALFWLLGLITIGADQVCPWFFEYERYKTSLLQVK